MAIWISVKEERKLFPNINKEKRKLFLMSSEVSSMLKGLVWMLVSVSVMFLLSILVRREKKKCIFHHWSGIKITKITIILLHSSFKSPSVLSYLAASICDGSAQHRVTEVTGN